MSITPGIDQQHVVQFIADTHKTWKNNRLQLEQLWRDCFFRAYSRWPGGANITNGANDNERYYHPAIENMVDTVSAKLSTAVMPGETFWDVTSRTPDQQMNCDNLSAILKWGHMKNGFRKELSKMVRQAVITGNSPWHVTWAIRQTSVPDQKELLQREQIIREAQSLGQPFRPLQVPTMPLITYTGPDFFTSSCFDFIKDPWPEDETTAMRMRRFFKSPDSVSKMGQQNEFGYSIYENTENIPPSNETEMSDAVKQQVKLSLGLTGDYEGKDKIEIIECFGDIPVRFEGDEETIILYNHVAVIANKTRLLRLEPLPFEHGMIPCDNYQLMPRPGEPYGPGYVERCIGIHDAILERFTQSIVAHAFAINPQWFFKPDGLFDPDEFENFPGALHAYSNEMPRPFEVPDKAMEGFGEVALLKAEISEAAGSIIDLNTKGERSATETSVVAQMGNARFAEVAKGLEETITTVVRQESSLFQQLLSDEVWVRVSHPANPTAAVQMRQISRQDILGEFDIVCNGASKLAENAQMVQQLVQITGAISATPAAPYIDWPKYAATLFEMSGLHDASSRFIKSQEQVYAEQQQALMSQLGGPAGPGGPGQQPGVPGVGSAPGLPNPATAGAPANNGAGMGSPESAPGRRPLST